MSTWWTVAFVAQWILLIVLAVVVVALARQVGTLHLRLGPLGALEVDDEGPPLGEPLDVHHATDPHGQPVTFGGPADRGRLALFTSPTCGICRQVAPGVPAVATAGGLEPLLLSDPGAEQALDVPGTPYAVVLDRLGVVRAKGTVNNLEQLEGLVDTAARRVEELGPAGEAHPEAM
ncbi:MAG: hypothetical protein WEA10_05955 [Actinomycetota bacterium]